MISSTAITSLSSWGKKENINNLRKKKDKRAVNLRFMFKKGARKKKGRGEK